jgi:hypothetical protein
MTTRPLRVLLAAAGCGALMLSAGCETTPLEPSPNFVGDTVIVTDFAQFFRLGPQQAGGADLSLRTGELVMLQRKEFGYSRVQLEDGQVGYMANEDLQPAPPEPRRKRGLRNGAAQTGNERSRRSSGANAAVGTEEEFYEDIALPDPNLDIMPEDVPVEPLPPVPTAPESAPPNQSPRKPVQIPRPGTGPAPASAPAPAEPTPQPETTPPTSTST